MAKTPTLLIEWIDQQDSGWVKGDIENNPAIAYQNPQKVTCPNRAYIPNTGFMREEVTEVVDGKERKVLKNVAIRYIANCPYIRVDEQEKNGFKPHVDKSVDKIAIDKGYSTIVREGDIALYDYLMVVNYNASNPKRSLSAGALFRVVELNKDLEKASEDKFTVAEALMKVKGLAKKTKQGYIYEDVKIDGLCALFNLYGETPQEKIEKLTNIAESDAEKFLEMVTKYEETTITDVTHAIQLGVIRINKGSVEYVESNKIITSFEDKTIKKGDAIEKFADLLKTPEYHHVYIELKTNIEVAKEKQFESETI